MFNPFYMGDLLYKYIWQVYASGNGHIQVDVLNEGFNRGIHSTMRVRGNVNYNLNSPMIILYECDFTRLVCFFIHVHLRANEHIQVEVLNESCLWVGGSKPSLSLTH